MYCAPVDHSLMLVNRDRGYSVETFADKRELVMWLLARMDDEDLAQIKDVTIPQLLSEQEDEDT